jgi:cob(I)alamin adenosyltransferase
MKIYTKTGDKGGTSLFNGERVRKNSLRVNCYGTTDELNSIIGLARAFGAEDDLDADLKMISHALFNLGSDLATPLTPTPKHEPPRITKEQIEGLESLIDKYTAIIPPIRYFVLPGGSKRGAFLHQARTVCRRSERLVSELLEHEELGENTLAYINRLSDYLFVASRYANFKENIEDIKWEA